MSASFHMAQRTGVILSGDYSGDYSGEYLPKKNQYGITSFGHVWLNKQYGSGYRAWLNPSAETAESDFVELDENGIQPFRDQNVGSSVSFKNAVIAAGKRQAQVRERRDASAGSTLTVGVGTWNDGAYTYVVKSATEVYVPETGKTFTPSLDTWAKFVKQMNSAKLSEGKAKPKASSGGSSYLPSTVVAPVPAETSAPFYKAKWFLPAVAGGTVLLVLAIALWPKKKKDSAPVVYLPAPAPVPVPAPTLTPQAI